MTNVDSVQVAPAVWRNDPERGEQGYGRLSPPSPTAFVRRRTSAVKRLRRTPAARGLARRSFSVGGWRNEPEVCGGRNRRFGQPGKQTPPPDAYPSGAPGRPSPFSTTHLSAGCSAP